MSATDDIVYLDESHQYFVDGVEYPSVTDVLSTLINFDRVPRDILERKRQVGKAVHRAIELHLLGELDETSIDTAIAPFFESFLKFLAVKPVRLIDAEKIVYSRAHRVAGRLDLVWAFLDAPDKSWLIDAKAVDKMSPVTALQTAAYRELYAECTGTRIDYRAGLQLQADGSMARLFPYVRPDNRNDWLVFQTTLNMYRWIKNHAC